MTWAAEYARRKVEALERMGLAIAGLPVVGAGGSAGVFAIEGAVLKVTHSVADAYGAHLVQLARARGAEVRYVAHVASVHRIAGIEAKHAADHYFAIVLERLHPLPAAMCTWLREREVLARVLTKGERFDRGPSAALRVVEQYRCALADLDRVGIRLNDKEPSNLLLNQVGELRLADLGGLIDWRDQESFLSQVAHTHRRDLGGKVGRILPWLNP